MQNGLVPQPYVAFKNQEDYLCFRGLPPKEREVTASHQIPPAQGSSAGKRRSHNFWL